MADPKAESKKSEAVAGETPKGRVKGKAKAPVVKAIPKDKLVQYQTTNEKFMLPVKCGKAFTFVRSDKPYAFDKSDLAHQMLLTIAQEIKAGRLKEVA